MELKQIATDELHLKNVKVAYMETLPLKRQVLVSVEWTQLSTVLA